MVMAVAKKLVDSVHMNAHRTSGERLQNAFVFRIIYPISQVLVGSVATTFHIFCCVCVAVRRDYPNIHVTYFDQTIDQQARRKLPEIKF